MPFDITVVPPFPNVPQLPGVPQLIRSLLFPPTVVAALDPRTQGQVFASSQQPPVWGIFIPDTNTRVVNADSVLTFDNRNEWRVSDFPVQNGAFASYNKVVVPFEVSVRFVKTGTLFDRQTMLNEIAAIAGDTNLYNVVTPEATYLNCNVTRYEVMRRDQRDAYALWEVDVYLRQILQVAAQYSTVSAPGANTTNAQSPAAVPPINQGTTQPQNPSATASGAATAAIAGAPM